jgi:hypothetical protein
MTSIWQLEWALMSPSWRAVLPCQRIGLWFVCLFVSISSSRQGHGDMARFGQSILIKTYDPCNYKYNTTYCIEYFTYKVPRRNYFCFIKRNKASLPRRRGLVVSSPPAELWVVRSNPAVGQGGSLKRNYFIRLVSLYSGGVVTCDCWIGSW